jgi:glycosyltransferase involved in cell wall biosynthesis
MTIGLDLSSLQGPHRMRGIGYTLINLINNLPDTVKKSHAFIFYVYQHEGAPDPLELLDLNGIKYEIRSLGQAKRIHKTLPGKLRLLTRAANQLLSFRELRRGDSRITDTKGIDYFLQTDQLISLPRGHFKKAFIAYDVIPYVLEWDYLWNYRTARLHGFPRQAAIRCSIRRWLYIYKLRANARRADKVFAISEATKVDFIQHVGVPEHKITTVPLGINPVPKDIANVSSEAHRYVATSWGYVRRPFAFDDTPFLLFVGGGDKRRRLDELVTAFNHLRARGVAIRLVLAGDTMQGPMNISTSTIQTALKETSYIDDIVFMGFVDDARREWLYKHALAFVYPSRYEGFGLPILEAMQYGTPVVTYQNSSITEVAGEAAIFATDAESIRLSVEQLLGDGELRTRLSQTGPQQAAKYSWQATATKLLDEITAE